MSWIFEVIDRSGCTIHLSRERWAHIQMHPEMSNKIEQIKEALQMPDVIKDFEHDQQVKFYYKYAKERKEYLFITVKYLNGQGFIITNFYTDAIK